MRVAGATAEGLRLDVPAGVPAGERRAGLTSHWFSAGVLGQTQQILTGWLTTGDGGGGTTGYGPHTRRGYRLPPSRLLYRLLVGGFARRGLREARRAGFVGG